jgi:Flp pilus assembly pilin Flp
MGNGQPRRNNKMEAAYRAIFRLKDGPVTSASRIFIRLRESLRGQTMTEYAFVLAAVAIAVYATYQIFGQDVSSLVNKVDVQLVAT